MDSFPDIRSFSIDELTAFLAVLSDEAEKRTTDRPASSAYDAYVSDNVPTVYRRRVLNNKIDLVRAELANRRGRPDPGNG
jgi:hypothetical protein